MARVWLSPSLCNLIYKCNTSELDTGPVVNHPPCHLLQTDNPYFKKFQTVPHRFIHVFVCSSPHFLKKPKHLKSAKMLYGFGEEAFLRRLTSYGGSHSALCNCLLLLQTCRTISFAELNPGEESYSWTTSYAGAARSGLLPLLKCLTSLHSFWLYYNHIHNSYYY